MEALPIKSMFTRRSGRSTRCSPGGQKGRADERTSGRLPKEPMAGILCVGQSPALSSFAMGTPASPWPFIRICEMNCSAMSSGNAPPQVRKARVSSSLQQRRRRHPSSSVGLLQSPLRPALSPHKRAGCQRHMQPGPLRISERPSLCNALRRRCRKIRDPPSPVERATHFRKRPKSQCLSLANPTHRCRRAGRPE